MSGDLNIAQAKRVAISSHLDDSLLAIVALNLRRHRRLDRSARAQTTAHDREKPACPEAINVEARSIEHGRNGGLRLSTRAYRHHCAKKDACKRTLALTSSSYPHSRAFAAQCVLRSHTIQVYFHQPFQ